MRKNRRFTLRETAYRMLFEQDEEAEETEEDALGGEEEGEEEEAEGAGEAEDEAEEEQEEEEVDVTPEEEYALSDSIDQELNALLVDFEEEARKSAVVNQPEELEETVYRRLFEAAAEDIDLNSFAGNVARLVKNYQNLIDWESVILNKAESFINNHYGEDTARVLLDILEDDYDIAKQGKEEELPPAPIAVGARGEGGG
jgi:cobalamin biosynthesis protein CobT